ncbi:MAG: NAD(P)-dependent oxidoreductase [Conexivisphaerales archaeon]
MNNKSALVIGATSFIGYHLIPSLSKIFSEVIATTYSSKLALNISNVKSVKLNISDYKEVKGLIEQINPDVIYNLAGILSDECVKNPMNCFKVNTIGTFNILEVSRLLDINLVVQLSSVSVFRKGIQEPVTDYSPLLLATEPYGATKQCNEALSNSYRETYGLNAVSLRYGWIYGIGRKRGGSSFASSFIEDAFRKKSFVLPIAVGDWIYIKDVVKSLLLVLKKELKIGTYIIKGETKSTTDALNIVQTLIPGAKGQLVPLSPNSPVSRWASMVDDYAARKDLNWKPDFNLKEGILDYIKLLTQHYTT